MLSKDLGIVEHVPPYVGRMPNPASLKNPFQYVISIISSIIANYIWTVERDRSRVVQLA